MKITTFNGSPRAEKGNTNLVVEEFLRGAREAGADTENISLAKMNIKPCINCFTCWMETPGDYLVDDDMKELMLKFINSDLVIMATPIYVDNVTAIMKMFLERMIPFSDPHFEYDENGETRHAGGKDNPPMAIIAICAFPEQSQLDIIEDLFHRVSRSFHTRVVAEIFRGEASLLREPPRDAEASVAEYWSLVQRAGREVVQKMKISADTALRLEEPLMPYDQYVREANVHWDKIMATMKKQS